MSATKRQKIEAKNVDSSTTSMMITKFEQLPNELLFKCFNYFSFDQLYETFFGLNQRLNTLLLSDTNIYIDLNLIRDEHLLTFYYKLHNFLSQSKNDSLAMSSHDEIRFNLIMKNNLFQDQFLKLKSIALCNIHADSIYDAIFDERMELYKRLERLILHEVSEEAEHGSSIGRLCNRLISSKMEALKFLNINFKPYRCGCENNVQSGSDDVNLELDNLSGKSQSFSNLETLIIGDIPGEDDDSYTKTRLSFHTLTEEVLPRLPKLKKLFINLIHFDQDIHFHSMGIHRPTVGKKTIVKLNLNTIKIWTKSVRNTKDMDNPNKKLLKNFFLNSKLSDGSTIEKFYINNENVLA